MTTKATDAELQQWVGRVLALARDPRTARPFDFGTKVWLGACGIDLGRARDRDLLGQAWRLGLLTLARLDLVGALDGEGRMWLARSQYRDRFGSEVNCIELA